MVKSVTTSQSQRVILPATSQVNTALVSCHVMPSVMSLNHYEILEIKPVCIAKLSSW
jgi:hypothetical protein